MIDKDGDVAMPGNVGALILWGYGGTPEAARFVVEACNYWVRHLRGLPENLK